ncbi:MAG: hypothetical protein PHQ89_00910 [Bacilli bacterium]|nr:hypothetical protein [Bacilli bacterium]
MIFLTNKNSLYANPGLKKEFDLYCGKYFEAFSADQKEFYFKRLSDMSVILFEEENEDYIKEFKDSLSGLSKEELFKKLRISYIKYSSQIIMSLKLTVYRQMLVIILKLKEMDKEDFDLYCQKYFDASSGDQKEFYFKHMSEIATILLDAESEENIKQFRDKFSETNKETLQNQLKLLYEQYSSTITMALKIMKYRQMLVIILKLKQIAKKEESGYQKNINKRVSY